MTKLKSRKGLLTDLSIDDTIYRRDHSKRIELINWIAENMKNPCFSICCVIENKTQEITDEINKKDSIIERDALDGKLRMLIGFYIRSTITQKKVINCLP
jgi:hypothetical protein